MTMKLWSNAFPSGKRIPERYAFARPDPKSHITLSDNLNPPLAWTGVPAGARSLVLICHDPDVPSRPDDVNKEGRSVPADLARVEFFHWLLVDLPARDGAIAEGEFSRGVRARGKPGPAGPRGTRQGLNNYTQWFAGDAQMKGDYFGYDGPCPPWNDLRLHHYHFTLYALDVERCPVEGAFSGPDVRAALKGHVLAEASYMGTYALNPAVHG
jgi:Raf kinase inhibitor-like YbhB/YbcL family protein